MDFLSENQIVLLTSQRYQDIYIKLNEKFDIKYHELFILSAAVGYKHNRKIPFQGKGREMRSTYFDQAQKTTAYTIILGDEDVAMDIRSFEDKEFITTAKKLLEMYAEGGMEIIVEEVFGNKFNNEILDTSYDEYLIDIMSYICQEAQQLPF